MKNISIVLLLFLVSGLSLISAAEPTQYNERVKEVRADYLQDSKETKYYYKFSNNVCNSAWIASGDENVNKVLRTAYVLNQKVDIGVNSCSYITTVRVKN